MWLPFDRIYTEIAAQEVGMIYAHQDARLPDGVYLYREYFDTDATAQRPRMQLHVGGPDSRQPLVRLTCDLDPTRAPFPDPRRVALIAIPSPSPLAPTLLALLEHMLHCDDLYSSQLLRHFTLWSELLEDPKHPYRIRFERARRETPQ